MEEVCYLRNGGEGALVDFVSGHSGQYAEVHAHAAACADCQRFIAEQAALWAALDADSAPEVAADFDRRLYAQLESVDGENWWQRTWRQMAGSAMSGFGRPVAALSLAVALIIGVAIMRQPPTPASAPVAADRPASLQAVNDIDQIEETLEDLEMLSLFANAPRSL